MSNNKRQRITPNQWTYVSKAWNASKLAEQVTELTDDLETRTQQLNRYKELYTEEKEKHNQYKIAYRNVSSNIDELKETTNITLKTHQKEVDNLKNLSDVQTATNQQQIASLNEENEKKIDGLRADYITMVTGFEETAETTFKHHQEKVDNLKNLSDVQTATIQQQIASIDELKRQNAEERGRSKSWRVRYENLVSDGAAALALKTVAEYGVTPSEVSLFKNFAQKQAAAAKATQLAQEAAIEATRMGFKTLEDE